MKYLRETKIRLNRAHEFYGKKGNSNGNKRTETWKSTSSGL